MEVKFVFLQVADKYVKSLTQLILKIVSADALYCRKEEKWQLRIIL